MTRKRFRQLAVLVAGVLGMNCGPTSGPSANVHGQYVSVDCPAGDISLTLFRTGAFDLVLRHWNSAELRHTSEERFIGTWSQAGEFVDLTSGSTSLRYRAGRIPMKVGSQSASVGAMSWVNSTGTFADSFNLLDRATVDTLFKGAEREVPK